MLPRNLLLNFLLLFSPFLSSSPPLTLFCIFYHLCPQISPFIIPISILFISSIFFRPFFAFITSSHQPYHISDLFPTFIIYYWLSNIFIKYQYSFKGNFLYWGFDTRSFFRAKPIFWLCSTSFILANPFLTVPSPNSIPFLRSTFSTSSMFSVELFCIFLSQHLLERFFFKLPSIFVKDRVLYVFFSTGWSVISADSKAAVLTVILGRDVALEFFYKKIFFIEYFFTDCCKRFLLFTWYSLISFWNSFVLWI